MTLNKIGISLDDECTLLKPASSSKLGKPAKQEKCTVNCCVKDSTQNEFHLAGQQDIKTEYVFYVSVFDYDGQKSIRYEGDSFSVYRRYVREKDELVELYAERRSGA